MPVIAVKKEVLYEKIGLDENFSVEQFQDLCFDFGIELDNVVTEKELKSGGDKTESDVIYYKIEVPANRYDLLCVEGLAYSLAVFMGKKEILTVNLESSKENDFYVKIEKSVEKIRPYIVSAVIKNVELNDESFKSLIELQEKLHFNICRDRTLASIGVHNFDALKMPITYKALRNDSKSFVALNETESFTVEQLFNVYRKRSVCSVRPYLSILEGFDESPFVLDANDNVCSLPPIINSELTKVSENTKNMLKFRNAFANCKL
ncbi:hypothetical protein MHBO_002332 [Bonamia ostreae]|uniref:B3/B4 tRNA-binding domain-containing protein n=1 Tax=Bonamia ostreae TaxID=126728 RepID=A0ABV2ALY7_9EUKA